MATAVLGATVLGGTPARAHTDPAGCTSPGVDISITAFRTADGTTPGSVLTPGVSVVTECETIIYQGRLAKSSAAAACAYQAGTVNITTPDGIAHNVTPVGGVPCIGGTTAPCDPAVTEVFTLTQPYTVNPADVSGGTVLANISYSGGTLHAGVNDVPGVVSASNANPQLVEPCPAGTQCTPSECEPGTINPAGGLGACVTTPLTSNPCTTNNAGQPVEDVPGDCQLPGCEAGDCVAAHIPEADSIPCTSAPDIPGDCGSPGCEAGACVATHITVPDSTPCTTTPDITGDCGDPGCEAGVCVATHIPEADSVPCTTTPDIPGDCLLPGCEAGVCVADHIEEADSTPCDTVEPAPGCEPGCQAGACVADHVCQAEAGCRITGGGLTPLGETDSELLAEVRRASFGGQVGAPCGCIGCFDEFGHVQGEWTHVRHRRHGRLHASSYNSLVCGCDGVFDGELCNPGDREPGPEPRPAPANMACWTGVGTFKGQDVGFRVEVEDRGEPSVGKNDDQTQDVYRIFIYIPNGQETAEELAEAACCRNPAPPGAQITDGGNLIHGNIQIHPMLKHSEDGVCPVPDGTCPLG